MGKRRYVCGHASLLAALLLISPPANADDPVPRAEMFGGIGWEGQSGSAYVGGTHALGKPLDAPGLRLRAKSAYGLYAYGGSFAPPIGDVRFLGQFGYVEAMVGWQFRRGPAIVKIFAGVVDQEHSISPHDPRNAVQGNDFGAGLALESWLDIGSSAWAQFDAFGSNSFDTYSVHGRLGKRILPRLAVGVEAGAVGNLEYDAVKVGAFARFWLKGTELTLSGGATGAYPLGDPTGYMALSFYRAF